MSPRDNADNVDEPKDDFGGDIYAQAWAAMAKLQDEDLKKVPFITIESALGLVSAALGTLSTYWPVLQPVHTAVDLTRTVIVTKENVRKRIAGLRIMQADMLCSLFCLRDFKPDTVVIDNQTFPGRLQVLCDKIKNDVNRVGNFIDNYTAESWLGRILKETEWKEAVKMCSDSVETRKREILEVMALYTAKRADQIASSAERTHSHMESMVMRFKNIEALFNPVEEEEKFLTEVQRRGGPESCMQSDSKLNELAALTPSDEDAAKRLGELKSSNTSSNRKKQLSAVELRRLRTPVDQLLERNLSRFESKIDFLVDKAKRERSNMRWLKKFAGARPYERVEDPNIKKLWKEMGWGGSIDSRTFVLNLYDHFIDLVRESRADKEKAALIPKRRGTIYPIESPSSSPIDQDLLRTSSPTGVDDEFRGCTTPAQAEQDAWCLNYFNYRTLTTFMEALDDDMNGLIKIKEVNEFTRSKPEDLTLMQWIVYHAYGWLVSAHLYRVQIEWMITCFTTLQYAKENSVAVVDYTNTLRWVAAFLRTLGEPDLNDQQLLQITHRVMATQEQTAKEVLGRLDYDLGRDDIWSMLDLSVRGGPGMIGRIEDRIFPILSLVMQHHYAILSLAKSYVLEENALDRAAYTIECITNTLIDRTLHLRDHFSKLQYDVDKKMCYIAHGMFRGMHEYLSASESETRLRILNQWMQCWRTEQWLIGALQEYDPRFSLRAPSVLSMGLPVRDLVRVPSASPGEPDGGYELVAFYRERYGITLAPSVENSLPPEDAQVDTQDDSTVSDPVQHTGARCDGCMAYPIVGVRFTCVDCDEFDYCSTCHVTLPPPLMHPHAIAGHHTSAHRFIRIEQVVLRKDVNIVLGSLRSTPLISTVGELMELDPLIVHGLSGPEEDVRNVAQALAAYRDYCLRDESDVMGIANLERLDALFEDLRVALPEAVPFAKSRIHLVMRTEDGRNPLHPGYHCDEGDRCAKYNGRMYGDRYKCIDCLDFDYCKECFAKHWHEHYDGRHRFIVFRYPIPHAVLQYRLTYLAKLSNSEADPWKAGQESSRGDSAPPLPLSEDQNEANAVPAEPTIKGISQVRSPSPGNVSAHLCGGPCQGPISGTHVYRCLDCRFAQNHKNAADMILCDECAHAATAHGEHLPTHVLAAIPLRTAGTEAADAEAGDHLGGALPEESIPATIRDLSKRIDKIEETMSTLLSMATKLQEVILAPINAQGAKDVRSDIDL